MNKKRKKAEDYLKQPYLRILIPDEETGTFTAEIIEFPGCIAEADSPQEAYHLLENVAKNWIEAALDLEQIIPSPSLAHDFGGRFALRLPKSLHRQASLVANREGVSLNQFIVTALSEKLGAINLYDNLSEKLIRRIHTFEIEQTVLQKAFNDVVKIINGYKVVQTSASLKFGNGYFFNFSDQKGGDTNHAGN